MTGHDVRMQMVNYFGPSEVHKILAKCAGDKSAKPFLDVAQRTNIQSNTSCNMS